MARELGWYVYAYVNPLDDRVFYVGKGRGSRVLQHLVRPGRGPKAAMMRAIRRAGFKPRLEILAHGLPDAESALRIEAAVIDAVGLKGLVNQIRGWHAARTGRIPLTELMAMYDKRKVAVKVPAVLIRVNRLYRPGMTAAELYDATRGVWVVGRRQGAAARFAFAVFEGIVREVYEIAAWLPAGSTFMTRSVQGERIRGRWEFVGRVASDRIRQRYVDRYVGHLFRPGDQNPIRYVKAARHAARRGPARTEPGVPFLVPPRRRAL